MIRASSDARYLRVFYYNCLSAFKAPAITLLVFNPGQRPDRVDPPSSRKGHFDLFLSRSGPFTFQSFCFESPTCPETLVLDPLYPPRVHLLHV